ncbi:MAG TPA: glycosyltransferase family 4 protein [Candidatus Peribacterales bacterium]|nr:glycosyltransferase family 4 protein [Candidatus Peribacterales bacterium]
MKTILLISPYWKEEHRWMISSVKLAELWQRMGYRVVAVCMGSKTESEKVSETLTIHRVKDLFLPDPFNYGIAPLFFCHVLRMLHKENPAIVVVNKILFWSSLVTPMLRLLGARPIVTVDALIGMTWWPRTRLTKILGPIFAWTQGWAILLSASRVVFFHPQPPTLLRTLGIHRKSCVIPTGIDPKQYPCVIHEDNPALITVTYVGRLESVKGVDDFLAAATPLMREYPRLRIQVVGWYKENHPLVEQYRHEVTFTGLRSDIAKILQASDIFVLPSYSEGLSNALMEAMCSGCACVATEVGGNRFLIENGISGFLFPPGDRAMLQSHIRRLIDDTSKRQMLARNARTRMEKVFSWNVIEENYASLFADILLRST